MGFGTEIWRAKIDFSFHKLNEQQTTLITKWDYINKKIE